jgi:hypothetical protein
MYTIITQGPGYIYIHLPLAIKRAFGDASMALLAKNWTIALSIVGLFPQVLFCLCASSQLKHAIRVCRCLGNFLNYVPMFLYFAVFKPEYLYNCPLKNWGPVR